MRLFPEMDPNVGIPVAVNVKERLAGSEYERVSVAGVCILTESVVGLVVEITGISVTITAK